MMPMPQTSPRVAREPEPPGEADATLNEQAPSLLPPPAGLPNDTEIAHELTPLADPGEMAALQSRREQLRSRHGRGLREHAARGTMISTGFLIALSLLQLIRGFALAHFLTREDYGVWGLLAVSLGTLLWLKQIGIGDKYIQQNDPDQEVAFQKAFTLELAFSTASMVVLAAALPIFALVYGHWQILAPGLVVLAVLPAGALQAPLWIYFRNMDFIAQRVLQAIDPVVGFAVAMGFAIAGAGYWALAAGVVAGAWSAAIAAMIVSPYKLRLRFDRGTFRSYASFSWPLFVANGSGMIIAQSAILVGNGKLGLAGIGVLALASNITQLANRVDGLVTGTLYPAICAVRDKVDLLKESFVKSNRLALMWAVPFGLSLTLFAGDLVHFLLGDKWKAAIVLLQVYGATEAIGHIGFNWDAYMRATDRTRPLAVAGLASMITWVVLGIPLLLMYGLNGLAAGVVLQTLANLVARAYFLADLFQGFDYLSHSIRAFVPSVPAVLAVLAVRAVESGHRTLGIAALELGVYVVVTVAVTWWTEKRLLREALGYVLARGNPQPAA
jgi:O-antigen/teichoic acid export membrane protein